MPLRPRSLAAVVRRHRPEIVITGNFRDTFGGRNLNQADHIAVGRAVLDAVRDAGNRWIFTEQLTDGLEPWGGVRQVWAAASPEADARRRHHRHLRRRRRLAGGARGLHRGPRLGELGPRASSSRASAAQTGQRLGVPIAASFEVFPLGWGD